MLPSLNYITLTLVLQAVRDGNINYCNSVGLTLDEVRELSKLTLDEFLFISKTPAIFLDISVNHERLQYNLLRSRQESHLQQQINRAVRLGASHEMLYRYFGLSSNDVAVRRRLLGVSVPGGRKVLPDENTDAKIWLLWKKKHVDDTESFEALDAMMQITEELSCEDNTLSLTVVRNRIVLFESRSQKGGY